MRNDYGTRRPDGLARLRRAAAVAACRVTGVRPVRRRGGSPRPLRAPLAGARPGAVAVLGLRARVWARPPGLRFRLTRYAARCGALSLRLPPSAPWPCGPLASARRRSGLRWALPVGSASARPAPPVGAAAPPVARGPRRPLPASAPLRRCGGSGRVGASGRVPCRALPCGPLRAALRGWSALGPLRARPLRPVGRVASLAGRSSLRPGGLRPAAAGLRPLPSLLPRWRFRGPAARSFTRPRQRVLGLGLPRPAGLGFPPPAEMSPTPGPSHPGGETANTRRLYLIRKKDSARCPTLAADSTKRPYILLNPPSAKKTALPFSASVRYRTPRPMRSGTVNKIAVIVESSGGGVACGPSSHENTSFADGVRRAEKEKKTLYLDDTPCSARCQVRVDDCRRFIRCSRSTSAIA